MTLHQRNVPLLQDALVQSLSGMQGRLRLPAHIYNQNSIATCHEVHQRLPRVCILSFAKARAYR